jgi:2-dehydro-3-deoxyphosphogluconate aldolase/(4S)-4-hydroxy-2-oxoglutarate aldolase
MTTNTNQSNLAFIAKHPVIPVYYHSDPDTCLSVLTACYDGGIRVFEFTNRGEAAMANFKALFDHKNEHFPEVKLGIGTIKTPDQAYSYINSVPSSQRKLRIFVPRRTSFGSPAA